MATRVRSKSKLWTYKDYCEWPEDERFELIDGKVFAMTAPSRRHSLVSGELFHQLKLFFKGKPCEVHSAPFDVRLPELDESDEKVKTVVQPDIAVICDQQKLDDKGARGAPDLVVEVLSPSTASKDHIQKRAIYERHGVKEYWLVDPVNQVITLYRQGSKASFGPPEIFGQETKLKTPLFPGLVIDFSTIFPEETRIVKESPRKFVIEEKD